MLRDLCTAGALLALLVMGAANGAAALQACPAARNCAAVTVEGPSQPSLPGDTVLIGLTVQKGGDDQQPGGVDDIAALTATIGIPTLELADCSPPGSDGLNPSFVLLPGASGHYRVVAQNLTCAGRSSCLCPTAGEPRDEYINLLLFGSPGPAGVPALPNGELIAIAVHVPLGNDAASTVPLHLFSGLDDPALTPRPPAGAWLSIADTRAVDQTVDPGSATMNVRITDGALAIAGSMPTPLATGTASATVTATATVTPTASASAPATATATASVSPTPPETATATVTSPPATPTATATVSPPPCVGDCDHSDDISINELVTGVGIVLGTIPRSACPAFECLAAGGVDVSCLIDAVNSALSGCPGRTAQ